MATRKQDDRPGAEPRGSGRDDGADPDERPEAAQIHRAGSERVVSHPVEVPGEETYGPEAARVEPADEGS